MDEGAPPRLLWIDDEIAPDDGAVRLLEWEGFQVDCAGSGADGVVMAMARPYEGIILDLRLPDMSGLTTLEVLRAHGVATPVLVVTGYPTLESAVTAGRLGVWGFRPKTWLIEDGWTGEVHALVEAGGTASTPETSDRANSTPSVTAGAREHLSRLIQCLDGLATREQLFALLVRAITDPRVSTFAFAACGVALREVITSVAFASPADSAAAAAGVLRHALGRLRTPWPSAVAEAIAALEMGVKRRSRPTEHDLAVDVGIDESHLGRLIHSSTGLYFRDWRKAMIMRLAVAESMATDAQIAQVAYGLGYEHPSQFSRDFRGVFGVTPTEFRQLTRC